MGNASRQSVHDTLYAGVSFSTFSVEHARKLLVVRKGSACQKATSVKVNAEGILVLAFNRSSNSACSACPSASSLYCPHSLISCTRRDTR